MEVTWELHGGYMEVAWSLRGGHMAVVTWWLHGGGYTVVTRSDSLAHLLDAGGSKLARRGEEGAVGHERALDEGAPVEWEEERHQGCELPGHERPRVSDAERPQGGGGSR